MKKQQSIKIKQRILGFGLALAVSGTMGYNIGKNQIQIPYENITNEKTEIDTIIYKIESDKSFANYLTTNTIEFLEDHNSISAETYSTMFKSIRDKAEQEPDIMLHFGPNARDYLREHLERNHLTIEDNQNNNGNNEENSLDNIVRDFVDNVRYIGRNVLEYLKEKRNN